MVFRNPFKTFKDAALLVESGREFKSFGAEQENDPSHNEDLDRGTVKLLVSENLVFFYTFLRLA